MWYNTNDKKPKQVFKRFVLPIIQYAVAQHKPGGSAITQHLQKNNNTKKDQCGIIVLGDVDTPICDKRDQPTAAQSCGAP